MTSEGKKKQRGKTTPAFLETEPGIFSPAENTLTNPALRRQAVTFALSQFLDLQERYKNIAELSEICAAIKRTVAKLKKRRGAK